MTTVRVLLLHHSSIQEAIAHNDITRAECKQNVTFSDVHSYYEIVSATIRTRLHEVIAVGPISSLSEAELEFAWPFIYNVDHRTRR